MPKFSPPAKGDTTGPDDNAADDAAAADARAAALADSEQ